MTHVLERSKQHRYRCVNPDHANEPCAGKVFQSVTAILAKAVPKNLAWYGQTRGVIGVKDLLRRQTYDVAKMSPAEITEALVRERLTVNDHLTEAGIGGTAIHKALEDYATKGVLPNASAVPEAKRGSVRGLAKFIIAYRPEFLATEVKVLSLEHGYAGTFDLDAIIHAELIDDRGKSKLKPHPSSRLRALIDLKTSKWVYPSSHFPQLEAYEAARVEAGEPHTDIRAVLWVRSDGAMELVPSTASIQDFLALKTSAEVIARLDGTWRRPRKVAA